MIGLINLLATKYSIFILCIALQCHITHLYRRRDGLFIGSKSVHIIVNELIFAEEDKHNLSMLYKDCLNKSSSKQVEISRVGEPGYS